MAIDIFNIKPNVITRDLRGKSFLIYGEKKSGKTSNAVKFPKVLLIAAEKGYSFLDGVIAQPINSWREALEIKKQLLNDAKAVSDGKKSDTTFQTIVCDTADLLYDYCEKFIVDKEGVEYLDESQNMRAYRALSREYDRFFQEIVKAGYTLVIISHATSKQLKENGIKYDKTIPTVPERGYQVISRLVDVCAYAAYETDEDKNNQVNSILIMRGSKNLEAGSRNKYMSAKIPFTYQALCDDMAQAIDKLEHEDGATIVDTPTQMYQDVTEKADFNQVRNDIGKIAKGLNALDKSQGTNHVDEFRKIVENYLGKNRLIKDCDESQTDMLVLILEDLEEYVKDNNITI